jgi:hypothetical protein
MIHLALSLVAICVLAYFACLVLIAVGWVVLHAIAFAVWCVVAPFAIVSEFVGNWRRRP